MAKRESKSQPQVIKGYLDSKGWAYAEDDKGENYKIETCIFCGNESSNFEVHIDRGFYKTWCCSKQGSFYELRKELGDLRVQVGSMADPEQQPAEGTRAAERKEQEQANFDDLTAAAELYHEKIYQRPEALQYLKARGFTEATIDKFKLGCAKKGGKLWITVPHFSGGKAVNIKYRGLEEKKWEQEKGSKKILFNDDVIAANSEIVITEGELKSIALDQVGIANTVSLTGGVSTIKPEWIDQLDRMTKIYICLDSDEAGQKGAHELANRLGLDRCYNILLEDAKDPDEWLFERRHTVDEFRNLMRKAKQFEIKDVISVSGALGQLYHDLAIGDTAASTGIVTQWEPVNRLIKGFKPGELIILSAPPKVGKTTLALNIAHHLSKDQNVPVGFFCMEMSASRLSQKIVQLDLSRPDDLIDASDVAEARYRLRNLPLYFLKTVRRGVTSEDIFEAIKLSYRRYGLKLVVFDNLHFLVRGTDNLREKIGEVSQQFKLLAEELRIPIILIVHPRKLNKNRAMTADDFKESSSIHADADQVIMMHRDRRTADQLHDASGAPEDDENSNSFLSPETHLLVDASRFTEGGKVKLWYYGALSKFILFEQRRQDRLNGES